MRTILSTLALAGSVINAASAQISIQIETNAAVHVTGPNASNATTRTFTFPGGGGASVHMFGGMPDDDIMEQMDQMLKQMQEDFGIVDPFLVVPQGIPSQAEGPFLGVVTKEMDPILAEQLNLESGVVVAQVQPGSPAENSGISVHDLILAVGGKAIGNPRELAEEIRSRKAGDEVMLKVMRKGREQTIKVVLAVPAATPGNPGPRMRRGFGRIQPLLPGGGMQIGPQGGGQSFSATFGSSSRSMSMSNEQGSYQFNDRDGEKTFTFKSPDGTVVFEGPVNTDEERKKVPAEALEVLEQLENGNGPNFRLNIQPGNPALPPPRPGVRPQPGIPPKPGISI